MSVRVQERQRPEDRLRCPLCLEELGLELELLECGACETAVHLACAAEVRGEDGRRLCPTVGCRSPLQLPVRKPRLKERRRAAGHGRRQTRQERKRQRNQRRRQQREAKRLSRAQRRAQQRAERREAAEAARPRGLRAAWAWATKTRELRLLLYMVVLYAALMLFALLNGGEAKF